MAVEDAPSYAELQQKLAQAERELAEARERGLLAGAAVGALLGDPKTFGADFAFTALFIGLVAGFNKGRITAATVAASGATAAVVHVTAGPPWHVLAGALAGILAAYLAAPSQSAEDA